MKTFDIVKRGVLFETVTTARVFADVVPSGWKLDSIIIKNHTASACQVSFGYTEHGITVDSLNAVGASATVYSATDKLNAGSTPQDIYINANGLADTFNSCTLDITFVIEKYKPEY